VAGETEVPGENMAQYRSISFEVFMAVTMKNGAFWDVTPCDSCKDRLGISSQRASVASYS
jgi:hypothetical protein